MAKSVQQELRELRQRVKHLEGSTSAEEALPFLKADAPVRKNFDDVVEDDRREKVKQNCATAEDWVDRNGTGKYLGVTGRSRFAQDFDIPLDDAAAILH